MKKIQILVVCVAALAFGMMAVSSASATLWLVSGKSLTSEVAANSHGTITMDHRGGFLGNFGLRCTLLFIGSVGAGALGTITNIEGLKKELKTIECTVTEGGVCGSTGEKINLTAQHLPWHTLLELTGSATVDHILAETGKEPGYQICPKIGFVAECTGLELELFTDNGTNGAIFEFKSLEGAECSDGGTILTIGLIEFLGPTVS